MTTEDLLTSSYNYFLPEELIATKPAEPRDTSKLMVIKKSEDKITHTIFNQIGSFLQEGDLIVLNDTRVIPARLRGRKNHTGAEVEVFLIREIEKDTWLTLAKPAKRLKENTLVAFNNGLEGKVVKFFETGERIIKFTYPSDKTFMQVVHEQGEVPFPPYIKQPECDSERYQTVYSKKEGSVAAPTAGLHFTEELIEKLKKQGVKFAYVTLHVGLGTFLPIKTDVVTEHKMHEEYYEISEETANILNKQKEAGKRIIAVGTTATRVLETNFNKHKCFKSETGFSEIFIYPSYVFSAVNVLITNFHLPESTLMLLVSAFWDRKKLLASYEEAKEKNYHFYSFGDSMVILP